MINDHLRHIHPCCSRRLSIIFEPNKFDKCSLQAIIDDEHIESLLEERPKLLDWAKSKTKGNPNHVNVRYEPWEEVATGKYKVKFSWSPEIPVPVVDSNGTPIEQSIPLFSGSQSSWHLCKSRMQ